MKLLVWSHELQQRTQVGPIPHVLCFVIEYSVGAQPGKQDSNTHTHQKIKEITKQTNTPVRFATYGTFVFFGHYAPVHWFPKSLRGYVGALAAVVKFELILQVVEWEGLHVLVDKP